MSNSCFDWHNYSLFAHDLVNLVKNETGYRVAVSRAYYGVYWRARRVIEGGGDRIPRIRTHEFVWVCFDGIVNADGSDVRSLGERSREARIWADYQDSPLLTRKTAESQLLDVAELDAALISLPQQDRAKACAAATSMYAYYQS